MASDVERLERMGKSPSLAAHDLDSEASVLSFTLSLLDR